MVPWVWGCLGLGICITVEDPKLSRLKWERTDAVVYRDHADNVISDETLGDTSPFGFGKEEMAKREGEISQEMDVARVRTE